MRNPARIKIDSYLKRYGQLDYTNDFGDDWRLVIHLERIVTDYHFAILLCWQEPTWHIRGLLRPTIDQQRIFVTMTRRQFFAGLNRLAATIHVPAAAAGSIRNAVAGIDRGR